MTDAFLDTVSTATNIAYTVFFLAAIWKEYRGKTLAALRKACQHYWTAVALTALLVVINLVSVPYDGWWQVLTSLITLAACSYYAVMADRKRDCRVIQEMQRDLGRDA